MTKQKRVKAETKNWEKVLEDFFIKKLPALPDGAKKFIVAYGPWLALLGLVIGAVTILKVLYWMAYTPVLYKYGYHYSYGLSWWVSIASMVLAAVSLPGLFKQKMSGWRLMFYSSLVSGFSNLVGMSLISLVVGTGISLYILFQIKSYYK